MYICTESFKNAQMQMTEKTKKQIAFIVLAKMQNRYPGGIAWGLKYVLEDLADDIKKLEDEDNEN